MTSTARASAAWRCPSRESLAGATAAVTLTPADALRPALQVIGNASHIRVTGLTVQATRTDRPPVIVGSPTALTPELQPDDVTFDRVEVLAAAAGGKRGIEAHTRRFALLRSRVTGFLLSGQDSQAFFACNGPGPYTIEDNQLEASGENVLFGGSAIKGPAMVPGSIVIRNNDIVKPAAWRSVAGSVKNSIECKACNGALIDGNRIDGCWPDAQPGNMIVLTPRNQSGTAPDAVVQDVIIRGNRSVNHTGGYAVNVLYTDNEYASRPTARITIEGNLFQDSKSGFQLLGGVDGYLRITDNTLPGVTSVLGTFENMTGKTVALTYERNVSASLAPTAGAVRPRRLARRRWRSTRPAPSSAT